MIVEIAEPARKSELRVGRPIDAPENDDVVLMPVRANFVDLRIGEICVMSTPRISAPRAFPNCTVSTIIRPPRGVCRE